MVSRASWGGWTDGNSAVRRLSADPTAVSAARRFVRDTFSDWGLDRSTDAELIVSELVTNALVHGDGPPLVRLERRSDRVRIEVDDPSDHPPTLRHPDRNQISGRGLAIIETVATQWGHHPRSDGGKTVWAELPAP